MMPFLQHIAAISHGSLKWLGAKSRRSLYLPLSKLLAASRYDLSVAPT